MPNMAEMPLASKDIFHTTASGQGTKERPQADAHYEYRATFSANTWLRLLLGINVTFMHRVPMIGMQLCECVAPSLHTTRS